jgi:hypothetical protein
VNIAPFWGLSNIVPWIFHDQQQQYVGLQNLTKSEHDGATLGLWNYVLKKTLGFG